MLRWLIFAGPVTNKKATQNRNIKLKLQVKTSQDRGSFKPLEPPLVKVSAKKVRTSVIISKIARGSEPLKNTYIP